MISKYFIGIFIFFIVLFLYLHIQYHLVCSNDLEIYTIMTPSKDRLEEICDVRQPFIFEWNNKDLLNNCNLSSLDDEFPVFDIQLRDTTSKDYNTEIYLPFLLKEAINIFRNDKNGKYISENNLDFLSETGVLKYYKQNDSFLRPALVSKCQYDFLFGSINGITPLRYEVNYRNYFYVTSGEIMLKLIPPQSTKYLYLQKDYDNFEFRSPIDPWNVQKEFKMDYEKIKFLDVKLKKGDMIFIPAYWWYSIKFKKISSICSFRYRTLMNVLAISPDITMSFLQGQNIKRKIVQKMDKIEEKIDKLGKIVIEEKKKNIRGGYTEYDSIEKFNTIKEETQRELKKVKEMTDSKIYKQYTELRKKEQEEEKLKETKKHNKDENEEDKNEKLSHKNIEKLLKSNNK